MSYITKGYIKRINFVTLHMQYTTRQSYYKDIYTYVRHVVRATVITLRILAGE